MSKTKTEDIKLTRDFVTEVDDVCVAMDAEMFRDLFGLMSALVLGEVQIEIEDKGLVVHQTEEAGVAMTDMFIPKSYFNKLKAGKKIKELRLPVGDIKSILTKLSHGDVVEFTVVIEGKLHVEIKGKRIRAFNLPLFEPDKRKRQYPKVPFQARIKTTMEGVLMAIEDAQKIVSRGGKKKERFLYAQIMFTTTPMGLHLESSSDNGLYSSGTTLTSGWDIMKFDGKTGVQVMISIPYIINVIRAISKVTNMVQLEMATHMPLHIIAEMPLKGVKLEYWFAPRLPVDKAKKEVEV